MTRASLQRLAQWGLTVGSALLILRVVDLSALPRILASANALYLALALLIALAHFFAGAWRWRELMRLYSARDVAYGRLFNLYIASFFVSSVLPGTITGDGLRVYATGRELEGTHRAFAVVLLERLLGMALLALVGVIAWALMPVHPLLRLDAHVTAVSKIGAAVNLRIRGLVSPWVCGLASPFSRTGADGT